MTTRTTIFATPGTDTWTAPATLLNGQIQVSVYGAIGGGSHVPGSSGRGAGLGALIAGTVNVAAGDVLDVIVGANGSGTTGGTGYHDGGTGGTAGASTDPSQVGYDGAGGGGSTALVNPIGPTLIAEAAAGGGEGGDGSVGGDYNTGGEGGNGDEGDGATGHNVAFGGNPGVGGQGAGAGDGAGGAGSGGATDGSAGSSGDGGAGGDGEGPDTPTGGGGGGGGGGGFWGGGGGGGAGANSAGGGGGAGNSAYGSALINPSITFGASTLYGSIWITYTFADPPLAPTTVTPAPTGYFDTALDPILFSGTYRTPGPDTGDLQAVSLGVSQDGGAYGYWNGADFSSAVPVWVTPTDGFGAASGTTFDVLVPAGVLADGHTYSWIMACQESLQGLESPYSASRSFMAVVSPSATITSPLGTVTTLTPAVAWSETTPAGSQLTYRYLIYRTPLEDTSLIPPGIDGSAVYDSGVVTSAAVGFTLPATPILNLGTYYQYLQITETGAIPSPWETATFDILLPGPNVPTLTGIPTTDPTTGMPATFLQAAMDDLSSSAFYGLTTSQYQGDYTGSGDWVDLLCDLVAVTVIGSGDQTSECYDLAAPFNVPLAYRVRSFVPDIAGQPYASGWSDVVDITDVPSTNWWIVAPTMLDSSQMLHRLPSSASSAQPSGLSSSIVVDEPEQLGIFRPFGKKTATVIHGDMWAEEFDLDLYFLTPLEWANFKAIRELATVVLVKSDMEGAYYWMTLGPSRPAGISKRSGRQQSPTRGLTIHCTPTDPYSPTTPPA